MDHRPRVLCVAPMYPWPATDGYRMRLSNMVEALTDVGDVDLVWTRTGGAEVADPPPGVTPVVVDGERSPAGRVRQLASNLAGLPRRAADRPTFDFAGSRRALPDRHDLLYVSNVDMWWWTRGVFPAGRVIVDFDNLRNVIDPAERLSPVARLDVVGWHRLQQRCAASVAAVTVCSELDVVRSRCANAVAIPNGYHLDRTPSRPDAAPDDGGTVAFVGLWTYGPNQRGARWLADEVLPVLRRRRPNLTVRLVGRGAEAIGDLRAVRGVEVVGEVEDIGAELDRAHVSVVPLAWGAGTRLKVLEAFANRVPVVSTPIGVEGIDCVEDRDVLLARDGAGFADAVDRVLGDAALRERLVASAHALWEERYRWSVIGPRLTRLAERVIAGEPVVATSV